MPPVRARLYTIPGSHPGVGAALMLDFKGIGYDRTDLMPVVSKAALRAVGFPGVTVPAIKVGGKKVQGSRRIARELDLLRPEPPLFPLDAGARAAVEEAERFGDEELQHPVRQIVWWALRRDMTPLTSFTEGARLGIPINSVTVRSSAPLVVLSARFNRASDENARAALESLPGLLDRVDALLAEGTIGGAEPNAADFQIAPSVRLAMTLDDLRPAIASRPAGEHAIRIVPDFPGQIPPILPPAWIDDSAIAVRP
jgi:glutathione S-transferase